MKPIRFAAAAALLLGAGVWSCAPTGDGDFEDAGAPGGQGGTGVSGAAGSAGGAGTGGAGVSGGSGGAATMGVAGAGGVSGTGGAAGTRRRVWRVRIDGCGGCRRHDGDCRRGRGGGAAAAAGGSGGGAAAGSGGAAGRGGGGGAAGAAAGSGGAAGRGGSGGGAGTGGTPTPAVVMFTPNIRLNDDTGSGRQSEVALATGPGGLAIAGWMDERSTRVCAFSFSTNGGVSWSRNVSIPNATGMFVGDPAVAIDGGGTMYAVCQEYLNVGTTGNIRMMTSTDKGVTWSAIRTIGGAPDKPWAGGGITEGTVFVSWLGNPGGIKRSMDRGVTWGTTQSLGNIIHGTAITVATTGLVHVPYNLDSNRNQLRYLRSRNNGDTWEATRDLVADMGTFCFSCNPRQHPIVGAGADPTGRIVAFTWTSRMPGGQADDDVWVLYSSNGGDTWTQPIRVNDNTAASRQFESWVAVDNYGRVHVAWTDYRNGGQNETWYARSADPTKGFEPNLQVTDGRGSGNTDFLGDYKGIAVSGPDVLVVWQDTRRDSGDIYFSRAPGAAGP